MQPANEQNEAQLQAPQPNVVQEPPAIVPSVAQEVPAVEIQI